MLRALLLTALLASTVVVAAQTKPKPPTKKPAVQKPAPKPLLGTAQMPGDNGKIGVPYSMGNKGEELNFTLESAEFHTRYFTMDGPMVADKDHKLLLLTFSVQNPLKHDMHLDYSSFRFTVVSPDDENQEPDEYLYHPERKTRFDTTLKPAQKVKAIMVFPIHPAGPVNKLIVKRREGGVLRYDLRNLVKPFSGPFAKNGGIDIAPEGEGAIGTPFSVGAFDWTVEKIEQSTAKFGNHEPNEDEVFWVVTATVMNNGLTPSQVSYNTIVPKMKDADGETLDWVEDFLGINSNKTLEPELKPGESVRGKFLFKVPKGAQPAKIELFEYRLSGRTIIIKL